MRRTLALSLIVMLSIRVAVAGTPKDKHVGRFGGLVVTATALQIAPGNITTIVGNTEKHLVIIFVTIKNAGKNAACVSLVPRLKASYGIEYAQSLERILVSFPNPPVISEMLPGEQSEGAYVFLAKDGVDPLELSLKRQGKSIRCNAPPEGTFGDVRVPDEIQLDVHDLPAPTVQ